MMAMKYVRWMWRSMAGVRLNVGLRIVMGVAQVALGLLMVVVSKHFIDVAIRSGTRRDVVVTIVLLVAVTVGAIALRQLSYYMATMAQTLLTNRLRLSLFSRLFSRQLYEERLLHSGDVTSRLEKDIDTAADAVTQQLPQMAVMGVQLVGAFLLMRSMDPRLAWLLLVLTPVAVVLGKLVSHRLRSMTADIRRQESHIQMQLQEGMEHQEVLRSLDSTAWVTSRLDQSQRQLTTSVLRRTRFTMVSRLLLASTFGLGYLLAFVWGGLQLRDGAITFGVMTSFLQLVSQIQNPVLQILNMVPQLIHATASIDRLDELTAGTAEEAPTADATTITPPLGVQLSDVSFRYADGDRAVLSHFTHLFAPGSKTALTGPTGVGKTTLLRLLMAFARADEGQIALVGADGSRQPVSPATRGHFVLVPQGNTLMSGTIRYNLLLARPTATDDELRHVLHTAMADFVFQLPQGLDTELGERGAGLSEGQAQRIAIARGLLRPGAILLLDEISSALDEDTERQLFERLFAACPQKTMLFITHRPAVLALCSASVALA